MFEPIPINEEVKIVKPLDIERFRVKVTDNIPKPDVVLSINSQIVSTRKNIFGITGKAKVGKSFLMTLINGVVLKKGKLGALESYLPKGKDKILFIDTEQSNFHVNLVLKRIEKISTNLENLLMYAFDAVKTTERYAFTEHLIYNTKGLGLVIIDGIADLVHSVNDEVVAVDLADSLRRWATECDVAIGYVLHQNPSDNSKMRGHLGTVLMNKSETVLQIQSAPDNDSIKIVDTTQTRNKKPDSWSFEIIDGNPEIMDDVYQEEKKTTKAQPMDDTIRITHLNAIFSDVNPKIGIGYTVLLEKLFTALKTTKTGSREFISYAKESGWIYQDVPKGNYYISVQ